MKAVSTWSSAPYRPPFVCCGDIYICRIVPFETSIHFEWLEMEGAEGYQIFCRKRGQDVFILTGQTDKNSFEITGLEAKTDYEFYVTSGLLKSRVRLARTGI